MYKKLLIVILLFLHSFALFAQEQLRELFSDPSVKEASAKYKPKSKNAPVYVRLPLIDDFSDYAGYPKESLWMDNSTFVNQKYSYLPPTTGVLTFDALDATGALYSQAAPNRTFAADTLTSQYIRLDSVFTPNPKKLEIADSIYLSFYFQPGGGAGKMWERSGLTPGFSDSLVLEFYNPVDSVWEWAWSQHGIPVDSIIQETDWGFKYVLIPILKDEYLSNQFQFRFRNFCSLNDQNYKPGFLGNCDQWHIDYVRLDKGRNYKDTAYKDVTFTNYALSFLEKYQAMPFIQYNKDELKESVQMYIANLDSARSFSWYHYDVFYNGEWMSRYDGGFNDIDPFFPTHQYQTFPYHANPAVNNMVFSDPMLNESIYTIRHVVKISADGTTSDFRPQNDTLEFAQVFSNYYAYDDGSAENGYGLSSQTGVALIAYKYALNVQDTLSSVEIYFNSTYNNGNILPFYLTIWNDNNGVPGKVIYRSKDILYPEFKGLDKYNRYVLDQPMLVKGAIYIGIEQINTNFINIGFDRNNDASSNIFYNIGTGWKNTVYSGALMMRPYFGWKGAIIGIETVPQPPKFTIYPNPASDFIHLNWNSHALSAEKFEVRIYNMLGQVVWQSKTTSNTINVSNLPNGIYSFCIIDKKNRIQYSRQLIISR